MSDRHKIKTNVKYALYIDEENNNYILKNNNFFQPEVADLLNSVKLLLQSIISSSEKSEMSLLKHIIERVFFGYLIYYNSPVNKTVFINNESGDNITFNNSKGYIKININDFKQITE